MGKPRILVFAVVASLGLAACGGTSGGGGTPTQNKPTKVQIAAEGPFTGDQASSGAGALNAIKLAVDMTVAGVARMNLQGNAEQQSQDVLQAVRLIFPEAVILVREAREGFGT